MNAAEIASKLQQLRAELAQLESVTDDGAFIASRARRGELAAEVAELSRMHLRAEKREQEEAEAGQRAELEAARTLANSPIDLTQATDRIVALHREARQIFRAIEAEVTLRDEAARRATRIARNLDEPPRVAPPSLGVECRSIAGAIAKDVVSNGEDVRAAMYIAENLLTPSNAAIDDAPRWTGEARA